MNMTRTCLCLAACAAFAGLPLVTHAQNQPATSAAAVPGQPEVTGPALPPTAAARNEAGARAETKPLREQSIYIPYGKLRAVFEKEGRGVFLPYDKFQELWQQARGKHVPETQPRPPAGAVITEVESEATVEKDVVVVQAEVQIELLEKGWHEVPLRLNDAALRSARIGDEPARIVLDPQTGCRLLVKNDRAEPTRIQLSLEYAKAFSKTPGQNSVSFQAPQAPINRWRIRIGQPGVKVNIQPLIAATEVIGSVATGAPKLDDPAPRPADGPAAPAASDAPPVERAGPSAPAETVILAFVGAAAEVRIDWTPKAEGAAGLEALASVQTEEEVSIEEGVVRTRVRLAYQISRAELNQLAIQVPADQKVTGVFDPNVRQWQVAAEGNQQTIQVQLFEPARGAQQVMLELERVMDVVTLRELSIPVVRAQNVGRQQGVLVVRLGAELQAQPARPPVGLLQLDAAELPATLQKGQWTYAYRCATADFTLVLGVEKVQPLIYAEELVEAYLEPEQLTYELLALFDIQRAGVFQLEIEIPAGYDVRQVRGQAVAGAEAAPVEAFHREGTDQTRLRISLARKALGRIGLRVELHKSLDQLDLRTPTGKPAELPFQLPQLVTRVERVSGRLLIYAPESLHVTPRQASGVRDISFAEALQGVQSLRENRFPGLREVLAMAYTQAPVQLAFNVERRKPYVTARQLLTARFESGVIKYEATFFFDVQYSGVKSLRIDVPAKLAADIRNQTPEFTDATLDPQPDDVQKDPNGEPFVARSFTGETEVLGSATIRLAWEHKSGELNVGKGSSFVLPVLKPMLFDKSWGQIRAWGQIVITKAENLDVQPTPGFDGLRPIDPQRDLMSGAAVKDAALAFEFHADWSLAVHATRYGLEEVKRTSIERAVLRMVVTRSDRVAVQALYRMRSAVQRLAVKLPKDVQFDTDPLRINGQAVLLETGEKGERYVPLVGRNPDEPFLLELRYTAPLRYAGNGNKFALDFPVFPAQEPVQSEPAVQKVTLCAYLPSETAVIGYDGPWTSEQGTWFEQRMMGERPLANDAQLVEWVSEGIGLSTSPTATFPTDGVLYTFTTLQPPPPPGGSLRLIAVRERWLNLAVFGAIALVGVLFLRARAATKIVVLTLIVTALVLAGVFAPTFALRVIDARLFLAIGLVSLVWIVSLALPRRAPSAAAATVATQEPPFGDLRQSYLDVTPAERASEPESPGQTLTPPGSDEDAPDGTQQGTAGEEDTHTNDQGK